MGHHRKMGNSSLTLSYSTFAGKYHDAKESGGGKKEIKDDESLDHLQMTNLPPEIELTFQIIHSCYECDYQSLRFSKIITENTLRQLSHRRV